jgi:hypothetical protein
MAKEKSAKLDRGEALWNQLKQWQKSQDENIQKFGQAKSPIEAMGALGSQLGLTATPAINFLDNIRRVMGQQITFQEPEFGKIMNVYGESEVPSRQPPTIGNPVLDFMAEVGIPGPEDVMSVAKSGAKLASKAAPYIDDISMAVTPWIGKKGRDLVTGLPDEILKVDYDLGNVHYPLHFKAGLDQMYPWPPGNMRYSARTGTPEELLNKPNIIKTISRNYSGDSEIYVDTDVVQLPDDGILNYHERGDWHNIFGEGSRRLKNGYREISNFYDDSFSKPNHVYRGMHGDEFAISQKRGFLKSSGYRNFSDQKGTLFATDASPSSGFNYAGGFAVEIDKPIFGHPSFVVELDMDDLKDIEVGLTRTPSEIEFLGEIPTDRIKRVWEVRVATETPGRRTYYKTSEWEPWRKDNSPFKQNLVAKEVSIEDARRVSAGIVSDAKVNIPKDDWDIRR